VFTLVENGEEKKTAGLTTVPISGSPS